MSETRTLITGADGFVGRALRAHWRAAGKPFVGVVRKIAADTPHAEELIALGDFTTAQWWPALAGVGAIVHLAGRAHFIGNGATDPEAAYQRANVEVTQRLATAAYASGVRRIVFASSVKANAESTPRDRPLVESDPPHPQDAYGRSKYAAEQTLLHAAKEEGAEVVILRLPLVYGPGVKGNFRALVSWIARGRPLPFGAIDNRRSLLYLENLLTAIDLACVHSAAAQQTYFVSDGEAISTPQLCSRLAVGMGVKAFLPHFPLPLLRAIGVGLGRRHAVDRLLGSFVVDDGKIRRDLHWKPSYTLAEGLADTARWWREQA